MIGIFAIYLLIAGAIIFFFWLRPVVSKRGEQGLPRRGWIKSLAGAIITWLLLAVISFILYHRFLGLLLIR